MKEWTLTELLEDLKFRVAFNEGQVDLEFRGPTTDPNRHFRDALNEAYTDEYNEAVTVGDARWFYAVETLVWPASQATLILPSSVQAKWVVRIIDVTDNAIGTVFRTSDGNNAGSMATWRDNKTLQWVDPAGPSRDTTLQLTYCGLPVEMVSPNDKPVIIPQQFRHLLSWSAAILLRTIADDAPPGSWLSHRNEVRMKMLKYLTIRGPIQTDDPSAFTNEPDTLDLLY